MNENLNPEHEEGRSSETGGSPPGQLDYRELFLDHVRKYDLDCIIASRGAGGKQQLLDELRKAADKIFGPLAGRIESPDSWVQSVWQQAQDYGYRLAVTTTARTAMDVDKCFRR